MLVTISPGLDAKPSGRFSVAGIIPTTLMGSSISATALIVPITPAAPHMSYFISSMAAPGFKDIPPESKVTPLPTSTMGGLSESMPVYFMIIILASWLLPLDTDNSAPIPNFSISASSSISISRLLYTRPRLIARSVK